MATVISVDNISKQYRLGQVGTGTVSHDLNRWWHSIRGKSDPYLKIGERNDRGKKGGSNYTWALKDISFEVKQGEVLGIIGRNGAGKSTLLKILSRTTAPTTGSVKIKGRVASLLEVGTGFHPDLTGSENIYLNGAILGMKRQEIRAKFDEIVDFAGIERYIDTPVKRYSSGMYVRLAFAVAAHLDSEILIVDEVLAVGDAEFQKKCLGRMREVSHGGGRTVLFVSHNMGVVSQLCDNSLILSNGELALSGNTSEIIDRYFKQNQSSSKYYLNENPIPAADLCFIELKAINTRGEVIENFKFNEHIFISVKILVRKYHPSAKLSVTLQNTAGDYLSTIVENISDHYRNAETFILKIKLPSGLIAPNSYFFRFALFIPNGKVFELIEMVCPVKVYDDGTGMAIFEGMNYGSFMMGHELV